MQMISGGVTAAHGFTAGGLHCGVRPNKNKPDLALIVSDVPCAAAAVYTQNLVQGAPIAVTKRNLADGHAQAIVCNSGNANTCNLDGEEKAVRMCERAGEVLGLPASSIVVASTGVIGQPLPLEPIEIGIGQLAGQLSADGSSVANRAIMTTDVVEKNCAVETTLGGVPVRIGGIAKGSGMIHPNMATMLGFITTDAAIAPDMLQKALSAAVGDTFNMISVDGDTSTNDMVCVLANGLAGNATVTGEGEDYDAFVEALTFVCRDIAKKLAADGEGATKLLVCRVTGAKDAATARVAAKGVICSTLLKAAMFGADANWGRVLCALGYSGADIDVHRVDVSFQSTVGRVDVCRDGVGVPFSEEKAKAVLSENAIDILVTLHAGDGEAEAYGCDLTYDYVKINGDYRT